MTQENPCDAYLKENFSLIADTPVRVYYTDSNKKFLIASWKYGSTTQLDPETFQETALYLVGLIKEHKPAYLLMDCKHLDHQITYEQQVWYAENTRTLWLKSGIKKLALVFKLRRTKEFHPLHTGYSRITLMLLIG
jgi:hypothetical protein